MAINEDILSQDTSVARAIKNVLAYRYNPSSIQQTSVGIIRDLFDGKIDVVDPTEPLVMLMEMSAINTAAAMIDGAVNTRKQYPVASQTELEVYNHMSDVDYIGRFASPSNTKFTIVFKEKELIESLVYDPVDGLRKLVIPRNSYFTVADTTFSLQYPIIIRQLSHGELDIVYDTAQESPLQTLSSNVVDWEFRKLVNTEDYFVMLTVDVQQFVVTSFRDSINTTSGLSKNYSFVDKFYHARVYNKSTATGNVWKELKTTHSGQLYDINKPTAVLKVLSDDQLTVTIPQIYITNNLISGTIRIDIYSTKGELSMNLSTYSSDAFGYKWHAVDESEMTQFTAPLTTQTASSVYSTQMVTGGTDSLSFEELRYRVINNAIGPKQIPITNIQIQTVLDTKGYDLVKNVDIVTNRELLATKPMPTPFDERLITAAASSISTVVLKANEAINHPYVYDNGERITLSPKMIFQNKNGIVSIVPKAIVDDIQSLDAESIATAVSDAGYLYTPFYYVLTATQNEFNLRPYQLSDPKSSFITFEAQNDTTGLQVNTRRFTVEKQDDGYLITVVTKGNTIYKNLDSNLVGAQLAFIPYGETERCYIQGVEVAKTVNNNRVFEFKLKTNFDIDDQHNLIFENFNMFDTLPRKLGVSLNARFNVIYYTQSQMPSTYVQSSSDRALGAFLLAPGSVAIGYDGIEVIFGSYLQRLWSRSRSHAPNAIYKKYETDVPLLYEEDIYQTDPVTGLNFTSDPVTGEPVFTLLHKAGDIVYDDSTGLAVNRFKKGDVVVGPDNQPVLEAAGQIERELDIMFIDGVYYFANDPASTDYKKQIEDAVVSWVTQDIASIAERVLDQTDIFLYPKTNMGTIDVMVDNGVKTVIDAEQSFTVKLYVSKQVYESEPLKEALTTTCIKTIDAALTPTLIAVDNIVESLKKALGQDVLSVKISNLAGDKDLNMFTIINAGDRASLKKKLKALPNNTLIVTEDVTVDFIKHSV